MRRQLSVTVPANTLQIAPYRELVKLNTGSLVNVGVRWRSGCHHRVYVTVSDGLYQIVPAEGTDPLYGDREIIEIGMDYPLSGPDANLVITAWSPGTIYAHQITAWFDIREDEAQAREDFLARLEHLESAIA